MCFVNKTYKEASYLGNTLQVQVAPIKNLQTATFSPFEGLGGIVNIPAKPFIFPF